MRAFVAVAAAAEAPEGGSGPAPEHLTLRFLGELPEELLPAVLEGLTPVAARIAPFDFDLEGVGAFPSPRDPRVVWVGVTMGREQLVELAHQVSEALRPIVGSPDRSEFIPHLTLFRVRGPGDRTRARDLFEGRAPPPTPRRVPVREFLLKESRLGRGGAVHRTVARFPLTGGGAEGVTRSMRGPGP